MPVLRKCAKCNAPSMAPISRQMQLYNSIYQYKCAKCGHEVELTPMASLGVQITVSILVAVIFWLIFFGDSNTPDAISLALFTLVVAVLPAMALFQLLKHRSYPSVNSDEGRSTFEVEETTNAIIGPVLWIEKLSFLGGLLAPIMLIAAVLGVATLIGYINFTYF